MKEVRDFAREFKNFVWPPGVHHTFALSLLLLLFNCQVVSDSLGPHGLRHTWLPCPSLSPRICPNLCPLNRCAVTIPLTHHIQPQSPSPVRSFQPHSALERMCPISSFHVSVLPICTRCPLSPVSLLLYLGTPMYPSRPSSYVTSSQKHIEIPSLLWVLLLSPRSTSGLLVSVAVISFLNNTAGPRRTQSHALFNVPSPAASSEHDIQLTLSIHWVLE